MRNLHALAATPLGGAGEPKRYEYREIVRTKSRLIAIVTLGFFLTGCTTYHEARVLPTGDLDGRLDWRTADIALGETVRATYSDDQQFTGSVIEITDSHLALQASGNYRSETISVAWSEISKLETTSEPPAQGLTVVVVFLSVILFSAAVGWIDFTIGGN